MIKFLRAHALDASALLLTTLFLTLLLTIFTMSSLASLPASHGANGDAGQPTGGQTVALGYSYDRQTTSFRSALSSADTLTDAGMLATTTYNVYGRPTISVSCRFSATSQTCVVMLAYVFTDTGGTSRVKGVSRQLTVTQQTTDVTDSSGLHYAPDLVFDSEGSTSVRVILVTAPGSGTVTLWVGTE